MSPCYDPRLSLRGVNECQVEGLIYLHSLRIIHRDLKPENVMIAIDGHIVLTNFSCAKIIGEYGSTHSDCGTREFEAPERILGWGYDYAADIWSFGILLCIMHFGQVIDKH